MFYTVNLTTHSTHTVKVGSKLHILLSDKNIKNKTKIKIGSDSHYVFVSPTEANNFLAILNLHTTQS